MNAMSWSDDVIIIRGQEVPVKVGEIEITKLKFYPENPRIYSIIRADKIEPSQEDIEQQLQSMEHVKELIQDIKENGGLMEAVIVKDGTLEVLEGNSRLAAYRWLAGKNPLAWGRIRCKLLPKDIGDDKVFALLGQFHIKGKKDWAPYEQAGFLYRRYMNQNIKKADLGKELGLGARRVGQLIETYEFMLKNNETDVRRWSYYEEYIKSNSIKKVRKKFPALDATFVAKVKSEEIGKAVYVREKLQKIACGSEKVISKFVAGEISFDEACERVDDSGNSDGTYRKLSTFRNWLATKDAQDAILGSEGGTLKKVKFEVQKLTDALKRLNNKLNGGGA